MNNPTVTWDPEESAQFAACLSFTSYRRERLSAIRKLYDLIKVQIAEIVNKTSIR